MNSYLLWILVIPIIRFLVNLNGWMLLNKAISKQHDFVLGLDDGAEAEAIEKSEKIS